MKSNIFNAICVADLQLDDYARRPNLLYADVHSTKDWLKCQISPNMEFVRIFSSSDYSIKLTLFVNSLRLNIHISVCMATFQKIDFSQANGPESTKFWNLKSIHCDIKVGINLTREYIASHNASHLHCEL